MITIFIHNFNSNISRIVSIYYTISCMYMLTCSNPYK
ncbi:hypothetical protein BUZ32_12860 [Staphylococcus haemolyticus]|nr:hypothetical protein BUZ32_12860 [Staphylococcus haemolyticus]PTK72066.1 hypothetical protein BUZ29_09645 [Staphylococcus haemolyticus]